jgi:hypothetical protein
MNCPKDGTTMRECEREIGGGQTRELVVIEVCPTAQVSGSIGVSSRSSPSSSGATTATRGETAGTIAGTTMMTMTTTVEVRDCSARSSAVWEISGTNDGQLTVPGWRRAARTVSRIYASSTGAPVMKTRK